MRHPALGDGRLLVHQDIISLFLHSQRKNAVVTGDGISRRRRWRKRRGQEERAQEVYCINSSNLGGALMERCQTVKGQFGECYLADGRIQFLDIFGSWSFGRMFYHLTNVYCTIWTNGRILFYHSTMCPSYAQSLDKWKSSISFIRSIFCYLLSHFAKTVCPLMWLFCEGAN